MSDLIRREDAIKAVWGDDINPSEDGMVFEAQSHIDRDMRLIPSADRPRGEWLDYEIPLEDGGAMPIQVCNLCKTFYPLAYTGGGHRFCPNCGARMKGAEDEDN